MLWVGVAFLVSPPPPFPLHSQYLVLPASLRPPTVMMSRIALFSSVCLMRLISSIKSGMGDDDAALGKVGREKRKRRGEETKIDSLGRLPNDQLDKQQRGGGEARPSVRPNTHKKDGTGLWKWREGETPKKEFLSLVVAKQKAAWLMRPSADGDGRKSGRGEKRSPYPLICR